MISGSLFCFSAFYAIFCTGFVFQFKEFAGIGLSPENLLISLTPVEDMSDQTKWIEFQMKLSAFTLLLHSLLPLGYICGLSHICLHVDNIYANLNQLITSTWLGLICFTIALALPITVLLTMRFWKLNNWENHPYVKKLSVYLNYNNANANAGDGDERAGDDVSRIRDWRVVLADLNNEFRRVDKFVIRCNPTSKVVVTNNWICKIGAWPWSFDLVHQSDVQSLDIKEADHHNISTEGQLGGVQYLTIEVRSRRRRVEPFLFRLNSLEFQTLQDRVQPITNSGNFQIFKSVSDRFVDVFKDEVVRNPKIQAEEEPEPCIGCMSTSANVKLIRRCRRTNNGQQPQNGQDENSCVDCFCRPMWCVECMAKWFASRQSQRAPETWLASKSPCPTCRNKFCMLDVSLIDLWIQNFGT